MGTRSAIADQVLMAISGHVSKAMLDHYSHVRFEARKAALAAIQIQSLVLSVPSDTTGNSQAINGTVN